MEKIFIPETQAGKNKHTLSWTGDEELITDACIYIKAQGDSMYLQSKFFLKIYVLIINYNKDETCAVCVQIYKT